MTDKFIFATNNLNKLNEAQNILKFKILSLGDVNFKGDIPEDFETLEENALQKAKYIYDRFNIPCFADDTGLEVDALNGAPGVYSARYAGEEAIAENNISKLLLEMKNNQNRLAKFRTVIAFVDGKQRKLFSGEIEGEITVASSGLSGFGYDPIFIPKGYSQTFSEMTAVQKNEISHRKRALSKFATFLEKQEGQFL